MIIYCPVVVVLVWLNTVVIVKQLDSAIKSGPSMKDVSCAASNRGAAAAIFLGGEKSRSFCTIPD
jgi:hypothetical protein